MSRHEKDPGLPPVINYWFSRFLGSPLPASFRHDVIHSIINSTTVAEPHSRRLWENAIARRQKTFQYLVKRYIIQLRYGCHNAKCTTKYCLSRQKWLARARNTPMRPPTFLTARMTAFFLASEDDPYAALCPHLLLLNPEHLLHATDHIQPSLGGDLNLDLRHNVESNKIIENHLRGHVQDLFLHMTMEQDQTQTTNSPTATTSASAISLLQDYCQRSLKPEKKDRKSLSQNLFDTLAVKKMEILCHQTPVETLKQTLISFAKNTASLKHGQGQQPGPQDVVDGTGATDGNPIVGVSKSDPPNVKQTEQSHPDSKNSRDPLPQTPPTQTVMNGNLAPRKRTNYQQDKDTPSSSKLPSQNKPVSVLDSDLRDLLSLALDGSGQRMKLSFPLLSPLTCTSMRGLRSMMQFASTDMEVVYSLHHTHPQDDLYKDLEMKGRIQSFVKRSLYGNLNSVWGILRFVIYSGNKVKTIESPGYLKDMILSFEGWTPLVGPLVFDSLWESLRTLFITPPELRVSKRLNRSPQITTVEDLESNSRSPPKPISDWGASMVILISTIALIASVRGNLLGQLNLARIRASGKIFDASILPTPFDPRSNRLSETLDDFEYEPAIRLMTRLVRAIGARRCFCEILRTSFESHKHFSKTHEKVPLFIHRLITNLTNMTTSDSFKSDGLDLNSWTSVCPAALFLEWLKTVVIKFWDGSVIMNRWQACGAAIEIMSDLYAFREDLGLRWELFHLPFLMDRIDLINMPLEYLERTRNVNTLHLLDFPFLFDSTFLVRIFRTLNFSSLSEAHQSAGYQANLLERLLIVTEDQTKQTFVTNRLKPALSPYLVLDVRRDHLLEDAFNQLWGREQRELLRPLKLRMGMGEGGEEGLDHGGVSQEFFRLVFAKAFDPDVGLFTTDSQTHMNWFQPLSTEPPATYELLGLLVSLAVYNGITLPTTFPSALYRKLLGQPVTSLSHIRDGWPTLAKSFTEILQWQDGDVSDVFHVDYAFTFESAGKTYTVAMQDVDKERNQWSTNPEDWVGVFTSAASAPLVTNANRKQFVEDYIDWLANKSVAREYEAFERGFFTCLERKALEFLSPELLKDIAEGYQGFDIQELKAVAKYEDGYTEDHPLIKAFWEIVEAYSIEEQRRLLEFVTASDRVPVNGIRSVAFHILRHGRDSERIPTSMTCFGRLLIPEYNEKEKLARKLKIALENSEGFGVV